MHMAFKQAHRPQSRGCYAAAATVGSSAATAASSFAACTPCTSSTCLKFLPPPLFGIYTYATGFLLVSRHLGGLYRSADAAACVMVNCNTVITPPHVSFFCPPPHSDGVGG